MLAKIAPRFVISRVIQNSYLAQNQAIELLKFSFDSKDMELEMIDPQNYDVCRFYGYLSTLSKPKGFKNKYEEKAYEKACQRFRTFNQTLQLYNRIGDLHKQARILYSYVERNNASSNFFTQRIETDKDFEKDIVDSIEKYQKFEESLSEFPQWQEKVKQEIGGLYHLIFNNLAESDTKRKVFSKLNHQDYFL